MTWKLRWKIDGEIVEISMGVYNPLMQSAMLQLRDALILQGAQSVELLRETPGWEPVP